jgi:hypothetical protein
MREPAIVTEEDVQDLEQALRKPSQAVALRTRRKREEDGLPAPPLGASVECASGTAGRLLRVASLALAFRRAVVAQAEIRRAPLRRVKAPCSVAPQSMQGVGARPGRAGDATIRGPWGLKEG